MRSKENWHCLIVLIPVMLAASGCTGTGTATPGPELNLKLVAPEQMEPVLARSEAELREGRAEAAMQGFSSVLKSDPTNWRANHGLAESYLALGSGDLALKLYESWPSYEAEKPDALQGRGIALLMVGNDAAAQQYLDRAVEADSGLYRAWNALGMLHGRRGDWSRAEACYDKAAQANPQAAEIYNNRGFALLQRGDRGAAMALFQKALRMDPSLETARNNLTLATALQGQYESALASVPAESMPAALNNIGYAALVRGDYPTAESYLTRAVESSPRHFPRANENLRWLTYLRSEAGDGAQGPIATGPAQKLRPAPSSGSAPTS